MLKSSLIIVSRKSLWVNNNNNNNPTPLVPTFDLFRLKLLNHGLLRNYVYIFLFTGTFVCKLGWYGFDIMRRCVRPA